MISRDLALKAASLLEREAAALYDAFTYFGQWDRPVYKQQYEELLATAVELRREAES